MASAYVFYSEQSDLPNRTNRGFYPIGLGTRDEDYPVVSTVDGIDRLRAGNPLNGFDVSRIGSR
jgi:hypothetical protein